MRKAVACGNTGILAPMGNVLLETARAKLDLNLSSASTHPVLVTTNVSVQKFIHVGMCCAIVHQIVLPPG